MGNRFLSLSLFLANSVIQAASEIETAERSEQILLAAKTKESHMKTFPFRIINTFYAQQTACFAFVFLFAFCWK